MHLADDRPVRMEHRHIFLGATPPVAAADFHHQSPRPWLVAHVPTAKAERPVTVIAAHALAARGLKVGVGALCLAVERRIGRGDETLMIGRQVFHGDAFDLTARFGPTPDIG